MNFSKPFIINTRNSFCKISPHGKYVAHIFDSSILVRSMKTTDLLQEYRCIGKIAHFDWSPDSEFILCSILTKATVQVFSLEHPDWRCKIDQGSDGLSSACWSPDSRHILTTVELHLWVSIWSLSSRRVRIVENIKDANPSLSFSCDGQYLAVVENHHKAKDCILLICCSTWNIFKRLELGLSDLGGFAWSPDSSKLCVWNGPCEGHLKVVTTEGQQAAEIVFKSSVNCVVWGNHLLCVGCVDDSVLVINCVTWNTMTKFQHLSTFPSTCTVYEEVEEVKESVKRALSSLNLKSQLTSSTASVFSGYLNSKTLTYRVVGARPVQLLTVPRDLLASRLRGCGVSALTLSDNGRLLACRSFHAPAVLWVWDLRHLSLRAALVHRSPLTCVQWEPHGCRLLLCTSSQPSPHLYVWTLREATAVPVPGLGSEPLLHAQWHPHGLRDAIVVSSRTKMLICEPSK